MSTETFGKRLRRLRQRVGLSGRGLARLASISPAYLLQLEQEACQNPGAAVILRLSGALGVSCDQLLGRPSDQVLLDSQSRILLELWHGLTEKERCLMIGILNHFTGKEAECVNER